MRRALQLAARAADRGEIPVGAVVVDAASGRVVAEAHNETEGSLNPLAHAELLAIQSAAAAAGGWRLEDCALYVTLEPCPMCAGAILNARLRRVVYGAPSPRLGADGGWVRLFPPYAAPAAAAKGAAASGRHSGEADAAAVADGLVEARGGGGGGGKATGGDMQQRAAGGGSTGGDGAAAGGGSGGPPPPLLRFWPIGPAAGGGGDSEEEDEEQAPPAAAATAASPPAEQYEVAAPGAYVVPALLPRGSPGARRVCADRWQQPPQRQQQQEAEATPRVGAAPRGAAPAGSDAEAAAPSAAAPAVRVLQGAATLVVELNALLGARGGADHAAAVAELAAALEGARRLAGGRGSSGEDHGGGDGSGGGPLLIATTARHWAGFLRAWSERRQDGGSGGAELPAPDVVVAASGTRIYRRSHSRPTPGWPRGAPLWEEDRAWRALLSGSGGASGGANGGGGCGWDRAAAAAAVARLVSELGAADARAAPRERQSGHRVQLRVRAAAAPRAAARLAELLAAGDGGSSVSSSSGSSGSGGGSSGSGGARAVLRLHSEKGWVVFDVVPPLAAEEHVLRYLLSPVAAPPAPARPPPPPPAPLPSPEEPSATGDVDSSAVGEQQQQPAADDSSGVDGDGGSSGGFAAACDAGSPAAVPLRAPAPVLLVRQPAKFEEALRAARAAAGAACGDVVASGGCGEPGRGRGGGGSGGSGGDGDTTGLPALLARRRAAPWPWPGLGAGARWDGPRAVWVQVGSGAHTRPAGASSGGEPDAPLQSPQQRQQQQQQEQPPPRRRRWREWARSGRWPAPEVGRARVSVAQPAARGILEALQLLGLY